MLARALVAFSAAVILLLGVVHLSYTFWALKLIPRDPAVAPVISADTTMWKAWIGFNASHGFGAILFGLVYWRAGLVAAKISVPVAILS